MADAGITNVDTGDSTDVRGVFQKYAERYHIY